jgi:hypothetical protein
LPAPTTAADERVIALDAARNIADAVKDRASIKCGSPRRIRPRERCRAARAQVSRRMFEGFDVAAGSLQMFAHGLSGQLPSHAGQGFHANHLQFL